MYLVWIWFIYGSWWLISTKNVLNHFYQASLGLRDKCFLIYRYNEIERIVNKEKIVWQDPSSWTWWWKTGVGDNERNQNLFSAFFQLEHVTTGPQLSDSAVLYCLFPKTKIHD